ncbi:MAG: sulfotransferase [Pseudomonadota bacterium]
MDRSLARARTLAKRGDVADAQALLSAVLERYPHNRRAIEGLKSLRAPPPSATGKDPPGRDLAAITKRLAADRPGEALSRATALKARYPHSARVDYLMGVAASKEGRPRAAAAHYQSALRNDPSFAEAANNLGNILAGGGDRPGAIAAYRKAIDARPGFAEALANLAATLLDEGGVGEALACLNRAVLLAPESAPALSSLGRALTAAGRPQEAVTHLQRAAALSPNLGEAHNTLANALKALDRYQEAFAHYKTALAIDPESARVWSNLGAAHLETGEAEDAAAAFTTSLRLNPRAADVHRNLSLVTHYTPDHPHLNRLEQLHGDPLLGDEGRVHIGFALGKALDDIDAVDRAFAAFAEANRLHRHRVPHDGAAEAVLFQALSGFRPKPLVTQTPTAPRPIFIVGMPRSGTTLVESIFAAHSHVHAGGELTALEGAIRTVCCAKGDALDTALMSIDEDALSAIRRAYYDAVAKRGVATPAFTDKLPGNFRWTGLILAAFPEATIIHVHREPAATAFSIFRHHFTGRGNTFAYDLDDIATTYHRYHHLMDGFATSDGGAIMPLSYEALTVAPEAHITALLSHCNLPFQDGCVAFHTHQRAVRTASALQVRQGVYAGSSDAWRRYSHHVPQFETLNALITPAPPATA